MDHETLKSAVLQILGTGQRTVMEIATSLRDDFGLYEGRSLVVIEWSVTPTLHMMRDEGLVWMSADEQRRLCWRKPSVLERLASATVDDHQGIDE